MHYIIWWYQRKSVMKENTEQMMITISGATTHLESQASSSSVYHLHLSYPVGSQFWTPNKFPPSLDTPSFYCSFRPPMLLCPKSWSDMIFSPAQSSWTKFPTHWASIYRRHNFWLLCQPVEISVTPLYPVLAYFFFLGGHIFGVKLSS